MVDLPPRPPLAWTRYVELHRNLDLFCAGVCIGLSGLCKVELAGAGAMALALGVLWLDGGPARQRALALVRWAVPAGLVLVVGFMPLVAASSVEQVFGANVLRADLVDVRTNEYFTRLLGLEDLAASLGRIALSAAYWAGAAAVLATLLTGKGSGWGRRVAAAALVAASLLVPLRFDTLFRALPVIVALAFLAALRGERGPQRTALATLAVAALFSLTRILFNAGAHQYGFFLAVPAFLVLAIGLGCQVPTAVLRASDQRARLAGWLLVFLVAQAGRDFVVYSVPKLAGKTLRLEASRGALRAQPFRPRYAALAEALGYLEKSTPRGSSLLVVPEGAAVNFLTGRPNPTRFNLFTPPELNAPGVEAELVEALGAVERVLVVDRRVDEYGFQAPGLDYGQALWGALKADYEPERAFGRVAPFSRGDVEGGAILLRRRP